MAKPAEERGHGPLIRTDLLLGAHTRVQDSLRSGCGSTLLSLSTKGVVGHLGENKEIEGQQDKTEKQASMLLNSNQVGNTSISQEPQHKMGLYSLPRSLLLVEGN
jgi:hypothetical protein